MADITQDNLDIVAGQQYKLTFQANVDAGVLLTVKQGTQQIFNLATVVLPLIHENITVQETVSTEYYGLISLFDAIAVTEDVTITIV